MSLRQRAHRGGFTLIEVVVAISIMVVIGVLAFSTLASSVELRDTLEESGNTNRAARVALDRIARELQLAFISDNINVNTFNTVFVGRDETDGSTLWFSTTAHRRAYRDSREADLAEITLWVTDDPEDSQHMVLLHRESAIIDQEPDQGGVILPLARGVTRFQVRFLDNQTAEWREEWDSTGADTPNRIPRAAQIVLGLAEADPDDETDFTERVFVRTVYLERAPAIVSSLLSTGGQ